MIKAFLRSAATVAILVVLGQSAMRLVCALGCEEDRTPVKAVSHCHDDRTPAGNKVGAGEECRDHTIQQTSAAARIESQKAFTADVSVVFGEHRTIGMLTASTPMNALPAGPPGPRTIPLRI